MFLPINIIILSLIFCIKEGYIVQAQTDLPDISNAVLERFESIKKSPADRRSYRGLKLNNLMKILLISDPSTAKSAASINIGVGSMNDSRGVPGISHLVITMVPGASKQHPDNMYEFEKFVSARGGSLQTSSEFEEQSFGFDVNSDRLSETLIRFAEFLLEPLLSFTVTEEFLDNTVEIIQNQYKENIQDDAYRITEVERLLSKGNHPYGHFHDGNKASLYEHTKNLPERSNEEEPDPKKISLIEKVQNFHSTWYSANIMNLVVLGKEKLDDLEMMVLPLVKNIENKNVKRIIYNSPNHHPWGPGHLRNKIFIAPFSTDEEVLRLNFPIRDIRNLYKTAPEKYLDLLLTHRGPGSLFSALRKKEFCDNMKTEAVCATGFGVFNVTFSLTKEGVKKVDEIINLFFQYILLLNEKGMKREIFEELQMIQDLKFKYERPGVINALDYVTDLSSDMHHYRIDDILSHHYLLEQWEPLCVQQLLAYLKPDNMNATIVSESVIPLTDKEAPYYKAEYAIKKISDMLMKRWKSVRPNLEFQLPLTNEFIPKNFDLYMASHKGLKKPYILHKSAIFQLWFQQDDSFKSPKLSVNFELFSKLIHLDPFQRSLWYMIFDRTLPPLLTEYFYSATLVGFKLDIKAEHDKFVVKLYGFSDTMPILLKKLLSKMTNIGSLLNKESFDELHQKFVDQCSHQLRENPLLQVNWTLEQLQNNGRWSVQNNLNAAKRLHYGDFQKFSINIFRRIYIQALVLGNCTEQIGMQLVSVVEESFPSSGGMLPSEVYQKRSVELAHGSHFIYQSLTNLDNYHGYGTYYQLLTDPSDFYSVACSLVYDIIREPCQKIQQIPSIVCIPVNESGVEGFLIMMMSKKVPQIMDSHVEKFFRNTLKTLVDVSDHDFKILKQNFEVQYYAPPTDLERLSDLHWYEISDQFYDFDRKARELKALRSLNKKDLITFFQEMLGPSSLRRRKLSVYVFPTNREKENASILRRLPSGAIRLESQTTFHGSMHLLPLNSKL